LNYLGINFHIRYCKECATRANVSRSEEAKSYAANSKR
jgi:hypothetical protein